MQTSSLGNKIDKNRISAISRLFSASVIREMSRTGYSPTFARLTKEAGLEIVLNPTEPIGILFDKAFAILRKVANRHEYVYKSALTHKVLLGVHSLQTASMINEFRVADCKADTVILNGTGTVYEIKSERDTLSRLKKQVTAYRDVFAKVNVITGENHLPSVLDSVGSDVGVMVLSERHQISTVREGVDRPQRTKPHVIFESIQMREACEILKLMDVCIPSLPNTKMHAALKGIFHTLDPSETHRSMVQVLKKTRSQVPLLEFMDALPNSLLAAVFSTRIGKTSSYTLISALNTPIGEAVKWN